MIMKTLSNAIRFLSIDMVEKANSGHPGMPMGMADVTTELFRNFLRFNPHDPKWPNRDRLVLSAGHGSALLYSALHLSGYEDMTLEQLKNFRQLGAITAGHPEFGMATGIETTTGPLGQGLANAVGMAIAERRLNAEFGDKTINNKTYVICGDGCLMEGISQEAISLAGHLKLSNLIVLFDDNKITIDGPTSLSTSENHIKRFEACGWVTKSIDGHNEKEINAALSWAQTSKAPALIACSTTIGFGSPNKAGSSSSHGAPLGGDEIAKTKEALNWPHASFEIPKEVSNEWANFWKRNETYYKSWQTEFAKVKTQFNKFTSNNYAAEIGKQIDQAKAKLFTSPIDEASRKSSQRAIEAVFHNVLNIIGGSADLSGSNLTNTKEHSVFDSNNYAGNYINYGIREHAMSAAMNGMSLSGLRPYGGTFLSFTDYARPAIRLSALMKQPVIYVMTHDSIGLGEDGPTHQPIEHLAALRAIPNLNVFRPADVIETLECWQIALNSATSPSILALSRQTLPQLRLKDDNANLCELGAYILKESEAEFAVTIFASGSEVSLAMDTATILEKANIGCRVVSTPCLELLYQQDAEYQMSFTCNSSLKVAIEAGIPMGWERLIGAHGMFFGVRTFGESAPAKDVYRHFGLVDTEIAEKIKSALSNE